jgi:putative serine protease PepD
LAVPAATVALSLAAGWVGGHAGPTASSTTTAAPATAARASLTLAGGLDVADVLTKVEPSVVSVVTTIQTRRGSGEGAGTGIVLDTEGHIITNAHVVADATTIEITVAGESASRTATLVAADTQADIAVLKVADTAGLVAAPLAAAGSTAVGDQVVAIGNALALEGGMTVTEGIVSALDRSIDTDTGSLTGLLQTDAAISSGNSGGPLVNAAGEVVGIDAAVAASGGGVEASNIGFAIPIDTAVAVANELLR